MGETTHYNGAATYKAPRAVGMRQAAAQRHSNRCDWVEQRVGFRVTAIVFYDFYFFVSYPTVLVFFSESDVVVLGGTTICRHFLAQGETK